MPKQKTSCAGKSFFKKKYQAQEGSKPLTPPLPTPLTASARMIIWFLVLGHVLASKLKRCTFWSN